MRTFVLILLSTLTIGQAEARMRLVTSSPSSAAASLLRSAEGLLPPAFHAGADQVVKVEFAALDRHKELANPCAPTDERQIFARYDRSGKVTLNKNFLPILEAVDRRTECGHGSLHRLALASLVHELSHHLDARLGASRSITFRALIGAKTNESGAGKIKNQSVARSPDPYELTNAAEYFAVNTEYFLLDKSFACRRPNLAIYLAHTFGLTRPDCRPETKIRVLTGQGETHLIDLDPNQIVEVQYLLAGKGQAMMSRFGHAMFKIVMRPPATDLVAGFVGMVDDTVINTVDGLTGDYPSRLVIGAYEETLSKYTREEFRDLTAYPIKLDEAQKRAFIHQIVTLYWEYAGRYMFLTNNCATEAMDLLKMVIRQDGFQKSSPLTPRGVLSALKDAAAVDETRAVTQVSHWSILERIFERTALRNVSLKSYWGMSALERRPLHVGNKTQLRAFHALERAIAERDLRVVEGNLMKAIHKLPAEDSIRQDALSAISFKAELTFGGSVRGGYGIPTSQDQYTLSNTESEQRRQHLQELQAELSDWGRQLLNDSEEAQEAQLSIENEVLIVEKLR
jgi:hypothetical protein